MIKREFKVNLRNFIIWLLILVLMFLVVYLIYPFMFTEETIKELEDAMKMFPPELLKAFNMEMSDITTAYGWFKSEGFTYVLLIIGMYSSILGGSILLKEENNKTIEYLDSLPIKRSTIVTNKIIVGISLIILMTILLGIFNYIGLLILGDFPHKECILLSLTPIIIGIPLFSINLFISTFLHKTKGIIGLSLGMVFIFYVLNILSEISNKVEFLKYLSIYTLADIRNVVANCEINPIMIGISLIITIVCIIFTYSNYNRKELI